MQIALCYDKRKNKYQESSKWREERETEKNEIVNGFLKQTLKRKVIKLAERKENHIRT